MRHVLEHNYDWVRILDNALASFNERMVLILFTPERAATQQISFQPVVGVPDIAFRLADITDRPRGGVGRIESGGGLVEQSQSQNVVVVETRVRISFRTVPSCS